MVALALCRNGQRDRPVLARLPHVQVTLPGTALVNRLWNLWCELSGTDPGDSRQKLAFNTDRRVATLSAHAAALVEGFATELWSTESGMSQHEFLDRWLAEVTEHQRRREEIAEREQAEQRAVESRRRQAEQEAFRIEREQEERRRKAEEDERRRAHEAAEGRRLLQERARLTEQRERAALVRRQVGTLYNITSVENLASIASRGILSHDLARDVRHHDVSNRSVQDRRNGRIVDGRPLHRFANLYINPRNAMLAAVHAANPAVVVLVVSADVLDLPGVVLFDGNAAVGSSRWWNAVEGLAQIDLDIVRSRYRRNEAGEVDHELRRVTQAEVLVPQRVPPRFIEGVRASSEVVLERAGRLVGHWPGRVDRDMFFEW